MIVRGEPLADGPETTPRAAPSGKLAATAALLFLVGALFAGIGLLSLRRERAADRWPEVEGRITASQVAEETTQRIDAGGQLRKRTHYRPDVHYTYAVGARTLEGTRVTMLDVPAPSAAAAEAVVRRYPAGSRVRVHYDPAAPESALLELDRAVPYAPFALTSVVWLAALVLGVASRFERPGG
jgi:hypothetical protein